VIDKKITLIRLLKGLGLWLLNAMYLKKGKVEKGVTGK